MKRFVALLGFLAVFPFFVSRRSRVTRRAWVAVPPAGVFPFINSLKNWTLWTEWARDDAMETYFEGPEAGEGAVQHWSTRCMRGTTRLSASTPDQRVGYTLEMRDGRYNLEGVIALEPVANGTRITWSCWWIGGENPYTRYFDLAMQLLIGRDFAAGLKNLKELAEQSQRAKAS